MKHAARFLLIFALVCATARAAPTSKLPSEWFVPLDTDSGRFALVDRATGTIRFGIMNPDGKTGFSQVVPTGITEVSDTASGILGPQGEEIVLTAPAANRVIRVTAAAEFPLAYVFQPLSGLGTSGVSESETAAVRKLLVSSLANAPTNISKLELRDPLTGALITELNSKELVQRLEPMTNPADGNRVSIGVHTDATGTFIGVSQPPEKREVFSSSQPHEILTDILGSAGGRHFIAFRNGFAAASLFTAALPITKTSSFSSASVNFPFPVSALLRVPGGGDSPLTDGVIALAADGTQAVWLRVNAAGNGFITTPHSFTPDPGSALTGLLPMPQGVVLLSGAQAGGISTDFKGMAFDGTDWVTRSSGSLPALPTAVTAAAHLLFLDRDPVTENGARVVGMQTVPDWTRRTGSEPLPASVVREIFQGSADGLRFNSTQAVTPPPGTNFVLANQADPAMSVVTLGTAASVFTPTLQVEPPSGSYDESFQVTATFDTKAFKLRFRRDGEPWQDWTGPLPVAYTTTLQFALQSLAGGAPGPVQSRSYLFTANQLLAQDSDGDGVPDFVELEKGLDPFGGADHDRDGISDLDELIRGTGAADANDPRGSTKENPGGNAPVLRGTGLRFVALPFDVLGSQMNPNQPVQLRTLTGGLLAEANTAVFDPQLPDNSIFGARLSTSASVPVEELVALSSPDSFTTFNGAAGREIIRFVPADPPPQLSVSITPTGANLTGDANAWINAARAAVAAVPFAAARTRLDPPDMAVSVLLEHLVHSALVSVRSVENPAPSLEDFSLFSQRPSDGGRLRLNEEDKVLLITQGFLFRKALTQSQIRRTAMSALANGIYARHSAASNPPSLDLPLDILRVVLRGEDLPPEYAGAATSGQIATARTAYNGAVASALGNFRPDTIIEVEIPPTPLGEGIYLGDFGGELEPVALFRLGRRFLLDDRFGSQPGTRFSIRAFTDLPPDRGRVALDVISAEFLSSPPNLDRDSDLNGLDDEWERFFFGSIGQNPGFIPPGHTKTLAQLFANGEDPRALAVEPDLLVEQPAGNVLAPLAGVNFGVMGLNSSQNLVFTVRNTGRSDLTGLGISFSGDQAGSFSVTLEPLTPVTPQAQSTFTVRFRPSTAGSHSAVMSIASNDPDENPFQVQLSGTGVIVGHPHPGFSPVIGSANIIALATQPDGKILAGGLLTSVNGQAVGNLARFNADGSLDTSFNTGTGAGSSVICLTVQADGKILVGGNFTTFNGATATRIVRLNSNGSTDSSFSAAFSGGVGTVTGIVTQPDGRLIVVGNYTSANGQARNRIVRLLPDGTLDGSFNPGTGADDNIRNAVVQADGRIVIAGDFANFNGQPRNRLARLNADGSLESTAGFNPGTGPNGLVRCLSLLPDGQIMIGGVFTTVNGFPRSGLAVLSSSGTVGAFTCQGITQVFSFIRQTDGDVIVGGGFTTINSQARNRIARITPATLGSAAFVPDTTFQVGIGANNTVNAVALAANGGVIAGGLFTTMNGLPRSGLAVLVNESPATNITVTADNRILWSRSGTAPEIAEAEFDVSADAGATFTPLGTAQFIAGGWQMNEVDLPDEGLIRVRAAVRGGQGNSSAGLVQTSAPFSLNTTSTPVISSIAAVTTDEDVSAGPIAFTVSDTHTSAERLQVTAVSSNSTLLPASGIALGGAGGQRTITLTPALNQSGSATVTVRAFDGARTGTRSFTFTAQPVNDAPGISPFADHVTALNSPVVISFAVSDVETPAESLIVTGTSSNTAVVPLDGIVLTGGSKREVRIIHAPNAVGSSTITLTVSDGAATAQSSFQVTVNNSAPVIAKKSDITLNEDFFITATPITISDNETPADNLVVTLESSNHALLPPSRLDVFGTGGSRFLSIQPLPDQNGSAVVTVNVSDGLLTTEMSFTVSVTPLNDAPVIAEIADLSTREDTPVTIPISVTDIDGPVIALGAFQVNPPPGAVHGVTVNQADRTVLITPPPDFHGTATFTVTVNDSRLSDATTFTLTVLPVNDAPSFTKGPDFAHPFGFNTPQTVENWATDLSAGPANEASQNLSFRVLSVSQPAGLTEPFFAAAPTLSPQGRLNYRTRGLGGISTIRLVIEDDGGTENGGVDRGVEQTFTITVGDAQPVLVIETENGQALEEGVGVLNVGSVTPGGSVRRQLTVRNAGQAPLNFGGVVKGGGLERFIVGFVQTGVLLPGESRQVQIAFAPDTPGVHSGVLTFLSNDPVEARQNYSITLSGSGASAPVVRLLRPNSVTRQSVDLSAVVNAGNADTTVTVDLGTTIDFGITVPAQPSIVSGGDETPVRAVASGLLGGTLYFYRVRAQNAAGVSTAQGVFFTETNTAGMLDESFLPQVDANGRVLALAVQMDGKIWVGGDFIEINGTPCAALARLNPDGSLDKIFNLRNEGSEVLPEVRAIVVRPDGRVVVGGVFNRINDTACHLLVRLNSDGTLDDDFANVTFGTGPADSVLRLLLQTDGSLIVGGRFSSVNGAPRTSLARLRDDGALDTTFAPVLGGGGPLTPEVLSMASQDDGRILIGGLFATVNGAPRVNVARLGEDGTLDAGFDARMEFHQGLGEVNSILVKPDGGILLGGAQLRFLDRSPGINDFLAALREDGSAGEGVALDIEQALSSSSQGAGPLPSRLNVPTLTDLAAQADGSVVMAGNFTLISNGRLVNNIARILPDGTLDADFQADVPVRALECLAIQGDGRVLAGGFFTQVNGVAQFNLARLLNDAPFESLEVVDGSRVEWRRGGAAPEARELLLDISTDGGLSFAPLGEAVRIPGGWALVDAGLAELDVFHIRARTHLISGGGNGSAGIMQSVIAHNQPDIEVLTLDKQEFVDDVSTHDFGPSLLTGLVTQTFVIRNAGPLPLQIGAIAVDGLAAADYAVNTTGVSAILENGQITTFTITFAPKDTGFREAVLRIASNDPDAESSFDVDLLGEGVPPGPPQMVVRGPNGEAFGHRAKLELGSVLKGQTAGFVFTIENQGFAPLTGLAVSKINGGNGFTFTPVGSASISRGQSTTFLVSFKPPNSTPQGMRLSLASNDPAQTPFEFDLRAAEAVRSVAVDFNGTRLKSGAASLQNLGSNLTFGVPVQRTFNLVNTGNVAFVIANLVVNHPDYQVSAPGKVQLAPGGDSTPFTVTFTPRSGGLSHASVQVLGNEGPQPFFDLRLQGGIQAQEIAVEQPAGASLASGSSVVDFGTPLAGGRVVRVFTLRNTGTNTLNLGAPVFEGGAPFTLTKLPPGALVAGKSVTFEVTFAPAAGGDFAGNLLLPNNDLDENPFRIELRGSALPSLLPVITGHPQSQIVPLGAAVSFDGGAASETALSFQWQRGLGALSNFGKALATSPLRIAKVTLNDASNYRFQAINAFGSTASDSARLVVVDTKVSAFNLTPGRALALRLNVAGPGPLELLWHKDGAPLTASQRVTGVTGQDLVINNLTTADSGIYTCVVTTPQGVLTGGENRVNVVELAPQITLNPAVMPDGRIGLPYSFFIPLNPERGLATTFNAAGLPAGLVLNAATGLISGNPTQSRTQPFSVTLKATNSKGSSTLVATISVAPLPEGLAGVYAGIIERAAMNRHLGGRFDLAVAGTGSFTGKVLLGAGIQDNLQGVLRLSPGSPLVSVEILTGGRAYTFTLNPQSRRITDGVAASGEGTADFIGWREAFNESSGAGLAFAGSHNFGMEMPSTVRGKPGFPEGTGFGHCNVRNGGRDAVITGKTADGEACTGGSVLSDNGEVVVFSRGTKGSLSGVMKVLPDLAPPFGNIRLGGELSWMRLPLAGRVYPAGFGPLNLRIFGGRYREPAFATVLGSPTARLTFAGADIGGPPSLVDRLFTLPFGVQSFTLKDRDVTLNVRPGANARLESGGFSGSFKFTQRDVANPPFNVLTRSASFEGVIIPDGEFQRGVGFFNLPSMPQRGQTATQTPILSGSVQLDPVR
ncbi:MAG TPA: hypothetical protein DIT13_18265 [Verrucomicrobiales bacterium]|nr:hypothetical protein [Verrucomicrobiales bacterium]HRJ08226.1 choice-of-anchor D domain-containing protein [Prosthecobacter sp.]HRK13034.1 choice-of-anchor D domain-containing protein [Prosthecobacter sp.]